MQYYLLFRLFDVPVLWWQGFWAVSVSFLVLAIIPTIAIIELFQRRMIVNTLVGLYSANELGITLTTAGIWFINLIVSAIIGSLLILSIKKIFKIKMKKNRFILPLVLALFSFSPAKEGLPDNFCGIRNISFNVGEEVSFTVYYAVAGIYVNAGTATFTSVFETMNNRPVYHIVGEGKTNPSYDWIYKVRDRYETYIDSQTMQPLKFIRNVNEGGYKKYQNITFNKSANTAIATDGVFKVPECVQDVVSSMYYARNIDFSRLRPDDMIPFSMFLDNKVYDMYIRYVGKEVIKTRYGKFNAIKIKPLLLKGSIFDGGEKMTVWVTDDPNHIPVRMESPLVVGNIKIDMMSHENLRHPLSSLIRKK